MKKDSPLPRQTCWDIFADENDEINWTLIQTEVERKVDWKIHTNKLSPLNRPIFLPFKTSTSHSQPLIQVADVFAGMMRTSYEENQLFFEWFNNNNPNFDVHSPTPTNLLTNSQRNRFPIIRYFFEKTLPTSLNIFINSGFGLQSSKDSQINFWFYEPENHLDKAKPKIKSVL